MAKPWHPADSRFSPEGIEAGGVEIDTVAAEEEEGGEMQGNEEKSTTTPLPEGNTSGRSTTRPHREYPTRRKRRKRRTMKKGTGTEIPQGGHM